MATNTPSSAEASASETAKNRLASTGRNDLCPCGSNKKYKKCHLAEDEAAAAPPKTAPDPQTHVQAGWRLFEQRRPGAAEKEFRAALALSPELIEARVGVGLAKLSAGDSAGARQELGGVVQSGDAALAKLREEKATDGFNRRETQPYLRAAHALGCLAYDEERYDEALVDFERVYAVDAGPVGTEARLIAGKTLVRRERAADAIGVLSPATSAESSPARAHLGLALAHFKTGDRAAATAALETALESNPHFGKALLGQIRKQVDSPLGAAPGSKEEAVVYAQTYGDAWDDEAKKFLSEVLRTRSEKSRARGQAGDEASAG